MNRTIGVGTVQECRELVLSKPKQAMVEWMMEREAIRVRRLAGYSKPWTTDHYLQNYFFCNAFRVQDKVTIHYMNWILPLLQLDPPRPELIVFNTMVYRLFNLPETMDKIGLTTKKFDPDFLIGLCASVLSKKERLFGAAYIISNLGSSKPKHVLAAESFQAAWLTIYDKTIKIMQNGTLEFAHRQISDYSLFGPFLSYEVVTDLSYHLLKDAPDEYTWANLGPGAARGINRLKGQPVATRIPQHVGLHYMRDLRKYVCHTWEEFGGENAHKITLRDVEHSLCEFDKYSRILLGEGRMKRIFKGAK